MGMQGGGYGGAPPGGYGPPGGGPPPGYGPPGGQPQGYGQPQPPQGYDQPQGYGYPQQPSYGGHAPIPQKKSSAGLVIGLVLVLVAAGAGGGFYVLKGATKPMDPSDATSSCDFRKGGSDSGSLCIDFQSINPTQVRICEQGGYELSKHDTCDTDKAIGGCAVPGMITWYYPNALHSTKSDVKKECRSGADFVEP